MFDPSSSPDLINPVTGDRLWFERLPQNPDDPVVFRCQIPAHSPGTPMHFHPATHERFEVLEGELSMCLHSKHNTLRLHPAADVEVPKGVPHRFWNATNRPVLFRSTPTPGLDFCRFLESIYGLASDGLVTKDGMPKNLLQLAIIRELSDLYFPGIPLLVQRPLFSTLSHLATLTGTRARMSRYWTRAPQTPQHTNQHLG